MMPRHWYCEAKKASFPEIEMKAIIDRAIQQLDAVVIKVASELPMDFPDHIASPIFEGMKQHARRFL